MKNLLERYLQHRFAWLFASLLLTIGVESRAGIAAAIQPDGSPAGRESRRRDRQRRNACVGSAFSSGWAPPTSPRAASAVLFGFATLQPISQLAWLMATILATAATARHAVRASTVDSEHLFAALDAYLLVGVIFGVGYSLLDQFSPESFGAPLEDLDLARGVLLQLRDPRDARLRRHRSGERTPRGVWRSSRRWPARCTWRSSSRAWSVCTARRRKADPAPRARRYSSSLAPKIARTAGETLATCRSRCGNGISIPASRRLA